MRALVVYAVVGLLLIAGYGVGGFSGWWRSPQHLFSSSRSSGGGWGGGFRGGK